MKTDSVSPQPSLIRALGPLMATAVVVGTVIGSGVFKKPQVVAANVPQFGLAALVWILGGVLALLGALALAEVAVLYPKAGGNYVFLREGYGRWAGFLFGWVEFWIIRGASLAALATIFTQTLTGVPRLDEHRSGGRGGPRAEAKHPDRLSGGGRDDHLPVPVGEPGLLPHHPPAGNGDPDQHHGCDGVQPAPAGTDRRSGGLGGSD